MADFKLLECYNTGGIGLTQIAREWFGEIASATSLTAESLPKNPTDALLDSLVAEYMIAPAGTSAQAVLKTYLTALEKVGRTLRFFGLRDTGLSLESLATATISCAMFPIATSQGRPLIGRIWCVLARKGKKDLILERFMGPALDGDGVLAGFNANKHFIADIVSPPNTKIVGRSWLAAAHLAELAASGEADQQTRLRLARDFIVTGDVDRSTRLLPVAIGNKLMTCRNNKSREWIIAHGSADFTEALGTWNDGLPPRYTDCENVNAAFRYVAGYSIRPGERIAWPKDIAEMHILVGGSIAPGLVSVLLTHPHRLHLWHSHNDTESYKPALVMKALLTDFGVLKKVDIVLHVVPSADVAEAERIICQTLPAESQTPVLFNVTSGTRLMMFAVDRISHNEERNVQLIYRDMDTQGLDFTLIKHCGGIVKTCLCTPDLDFDTDGLGKKLVELVKKTGYDESEFRKQMEEMQSLCK